MAKNLRLKFDVVEIVKSITSDEEKLNVFIPLVTQDEFKQEFGLRIIDRLQERLDEGVDKDGEKFAGYSKAYKNSTDFEIYGKSDNEVNLKLTGDMRADIDVVDMTRRVVTLGFRDKNENDKASGHVNGARHLPIRDFWGVPNKDLKNIMKEMIADFADRGELVLIDVPNVEATAGIADTEGEG